MTNRKQPITAEKAATLFAELDSAIENFERVIVEILETKAWVVLGYISLGEALKERVSATGLRPAVVRSIVSLLVAHDVPADEIQMLPGVGPIAVLQAMEELGKVRPASKRVRGPGSRPYRIVIEVDPETHDHWAGLARARGTSIREVCLSATRAEMSRLERSRVRVS